MEYASDIKPFEEKIKIEDLTILIDPAAVMFLVGSTMDYQENSLALVSSFQIQTKLLDVDVGKALVYKKQENKIFFYIFFCV